MDDRAYVGKVGPARVAAHEGLICEVCGRVMFFCLLYGGPPVALKVGC